MANFFGVSLNLIQFFVVQLLSFTGRSRDEELCSPKLRQQDTVLAQRLTHVSCGWDYTMAIDHYGKLIAWGSLNMAQVILRIGL